MLETTSPENWLRYWRNSLADAESGKGALSKKEVNSFLKLDVSNFQSGAIDHNPNDSAVIKPLFDGTSEKTYVVKALIRPAIYLSKYEHGKKRSSTRPDVISPIICPVWIGRNGQFYPAGNPTIPRDLLAPQIDDKFTIYDVEALDRFHTTNEASLLSEQDAASFVKPEEQQDISYTGWSSYYTLVRKLFSEVYQGETKEKIEAGYLPDEKKRICIIKVDDAINAAKNIVNLYDWLQVNAFSSPLLKNYIAKQTAVYGTCTTFPNTLCKRLGHSNSQFPLTDAQRDALSQAIQMRDGDILAVNGPPGTGKTTFILSVVASLWVKAALEEQDPPTIIAASTNNQAVTNVIDSFGKDFEENDHPISGRWLPDIDSYGGFFPAASKEDESAAYYQTKAFYENLEQSNYLDRAEAYFKDKAKAALNIENEQAFSLKSTRTTLLAEMKSYQSLLKACTSSWNNLEEVRREIETKLKDDPFTSLQKIKDKIIHSENLLNLVANNQQAWFEYRAKESLWLILFRWIPPIGNRLRLLRSLFIENHFNDFTKTFLKSQEDISGSLEHWLKQQRDLLSQYRREHASAEQLVTKLTEAQKHWKEIAQRIAPFEEDVPDIDAADKMLDRVVRFRLFQLAVHYWEAQWLISCRKLEASGKMDWAEPTKTGLKSVLPRWKRRMMLTPCIVSTLHSLPAHMIHKRFMGDETFHDDYLIDEIDLLIVDEAGQVSPEVAGASFSLAKKALVIGDNHQIEPVRSLTRSIDVGNLTHYEALKDANNYDALCETGGTVSQGSVMRVAQRASLYHYLPEGEPGMYLREHRRCYDDIISFSNELCYQDLLIPKRGKAPPNSLLPPMGYLHIDGRAETPAMGSRRNPLEANVVALWLAENRESIECFYQKDTGKTLEQLVAVITPFKAQKHLIEQACSKHGIKVGKADGMMTVGTVHALQGAERPLVIFSPVYSRHNNGNFIDDFPSILNVAASRAKDAFLVFGDMEVMSGAARGKPRFLLSQYLRKSEQGELIFPLEKRPDLLSICREPRLINNAAEHDQLITELLQTAQSDVIMVSPWISLSRLKETRILQAMVEATQRGVTISIYTDQHFNTTTANVYDETKTSRFQRCCDQLSASGVTVHVVEGVHSKLVMADNQFLSVGSFNWGSASRAGQFANMETSIIYSGDLSEEISHQVVALNGRLRKTFEIIQ